MLHTVTDTLLSELLEKLEIPLEGETTAGSLLFVAMYSEDDNNRLFLLSRRVRNILFESGNHIISLELEGNARLTISTFDSVSSIHGAMPGRLKQGEQDTRTVLVVFMRVPIPTYLSPKQLPPEEEAPEGTE
jgi:hypothetical protein